MEGSEGSVQREFPHRSEPVEVIRSDLSRRRQDGEGDRKIVLRPDLPEISGREVDDDPLRRERQGLIGDTGSNPLARLLHRRVGKPDDGEGGLSGTQIRLDMDGGGMKAEECGSDDVCNHIASVAAVMSHGMRQTCRYRKGLVSDRHIPGVGRRSTGSPVSEDADAVRVAMRDRPA